MRCFAAYRHRCSRVGCYRPLRTPGAIVLYSSGPDSMALCAATGTSLAHALDYSLVHSCQRRQSAKRDTTHSCTLTSIHGPLYISAAAS